MLHAPCCRLHAAADGSPCRQVAEAQVLLNQLGATQQVQAAAELAGAEEGLQQWWGGKAGSNDRRLGTQRGGTEGTQPRWAGA